MDEWIADHAADIGRTAGEQIAQLCAIPSVNGDRDGAERALTQLVELLPTGIQIERAASSTPGYADDLTAVLFGTGSGRLVLLGHIDTVLEPAAEPVLDPATGRLSAVGAYDMKGGLVLAAGVMRALADRADAYGRVELRCVADEEWRERPLRVDAPAADACLCFEGGEHGDRAIVGRRRGAAVLTVTARGRGAHAGSAPASGASSLLALCALAGEIASRRREGDLAAVPTMLHTGEALNAIPRQGRLVVDVRASTTEALRSVEREVPARLGEVRLSAETRLRFPAMDRVAELAPMAETASRLLGEPIQVGGRGGSSDAAFYAAETPLTLDGLGPVGGDDHSPAEYVETESLRAQAALGLACAAAALGLGADRRRR